MEFNDIAITSNGRETHLSVDGVDISDGCYFVKFEHNPGDAAQITLTKRVGVYGQKEPASGN